MDDASSLSSIPEMSSTALGGAAGPTAGKLDAKKRVAGSDGKRIRYTSVNERGEKVPVTGALYDRPFSKGLIALAPGTRGLGDQCAPSAGSSMLSSVGPGTTLNVNYEAPMVQMLLDAGYRVVVTDYIGLGTEGLHTYLNRVDQGHALIDAARATAKPHEKVAFWGYSQGGGAAAAAAELVADYAPELNVVGTFAGAPPADPLGVRERISLTGQFAAVDEILTGRENLEFFGRLRGLDRADAAARATELLAQFSLADSASTLASAYSGGMRRRLDIAASLCVVPRLLFLDEPTTGLDPVSREELWGFIRQLRDDGMTLVLTTQYLEEAEALADHVHLLKDRRIVASGTPEELRRDFGSHVLRVSFATAAGAEAFARCLRGACLDRARVAGKMVSLDVDPGPQVLEAVARAMRPVYFAMSRSGFIAILR